MAAPSATEIKELSHLFIGGEWMTASSDEYVDVVDSCAEQVVTRVVAGTGADVDRAVQAARTALPGWARTPPGERAQLLRQLRAAVETRREDLTRSIASEVGATRSVIDAAHVGLPLRVLSSMADLAERFTFEQRVSGSLVQLAPAGVVGAITPWNYPLHLLVAKVAPALAAGCTCVAKPATLAPSAAFIFAECVEQAGFPPGTFNLVTGAGATVGERLASHPDVAKVSFTGSTAAGRRVASLASDTVKRVTLELGGKSPNVLLDDLDGEELAAAVRAGLASCYRNNGQMCTALTRMLVPAGRHEEVAEIAAEAVAELIVGDPLDPATDVGPLVSDGQRRSVRRYIETGVREGARLLAGGVQAPEGQPRGYFVRPTVFTEVSNDMTIAREEIFGPVLCILSYGDDEDAVRIANDSVYGLAGAVWSRDVDRAVAFAGRLETGQVSINGTPMNPDAPFGGFKQSGVGRELGEFGLREYLEPRAIHVPATTSAQSP